MDGKDRAKAEAMQLEHISQSKDFDYSADIVIMTTYRLNQMLHRRQKVLKERRSYFNEKGEVCYTDEWQHPILNYDERMARMSQVQQHLFGKSLEKMLLNEMRDGYWLPQNIPTDYVVVVDDITDIDTGKYKAYESDDEFKLERRMGRVNKSNAKINRQIKKELLTRDNKLKFKVDRICRREGKKDIIVGNNKIVQEIRLQYLVRKKKSVEINVEEMDGILYFKKPNNKVTVSLHHKMIFTAAELMQVKKVQMLLDTKIHFNGDEFKHDLINMRELQKADNCLMIQTNLTRADSDGLLFVMTNYCNRVMKEEAVYVADGLGGAWNHTNTKGVNGLDHTNIVSKISRMHPDAVKKLAVDVVGNIEDAKQGDEYTKLMGDTEQIIGRNSGWRDYGYRSYCIIDQNVYARIADSMIYDCRTTVADDDGYGKLLYDTVKHSQKWFEAGSYKVAEFITDCQISGKLDANDYKRLIRIIRAVKSSLPDSSKKEKVMNLLMKKFTEFQAVLDDVLNVTQGGKVEYSIREFNQVKNLNHILEGLGITTKRVSFDGVRIVKVYISSGDRAELLTLSYTLRNLWLKDLTDIVE